MCCNCCNGISENCCKDGLNAVKKVDKQKMKFKNSRNIHCSIDIDSCFKQNYPNSPRWDYLVCYGDKAYFIEIHPANGGEKVKEVINKLDWLRKNILNKINCKNLAKEIFWIATGNISYSPKSKYMKRIEQKRIKLRKVLSV